MFFSFVNLACAGLEITEINNSKATVNRWIKIYNNDSSETLTEWFVMDDHLPLLTGGFWHSHAIKADGSSTLAPNSYAIITNYSNIETFKTKNPDISGMPLFYGSLTFEKEGIEGTMGLSKDKKTIIGQLSYGGASTSLNNDSSANSSEENPVDETVDLIPVNNKIPIIYKISTKIIAPKIATAGIPFSIDHSTTGLSKEKIVFGKFIWNFGDGMKKEGSTSDPFEYIYDYPGEYVLTLSYTDSIFDTKPDATDRLTIKVIPSGVVISSVGTYADPFVEIENNSSYEMSLNKWILKGNVHSFLIPEGMVILPNKKLKLSPRITGFDFNDLSSISIIDQSGQTFATYPKQNKFSKSYSSYSTNDNSNGNIVKGNTVESNKVESLKNNENVINLNDLGASAGNADNGLSNKTLIYLGLIGIIIIGIASVVLIRRKVDYPDYVEKEISAKDMTIIE